MVWAPNTSTASYFELAKTGLFDVNIVYNHGFNTTAGNFSASFTM